MSEPPQIELRPREYRVKRRLSVRDGQMIFTLVVALFFLALAYWNREDYGPDLLFWSAAFFGMLGGGALVVLFRRWI